MITGNHYRAAFADGTEVFRAPQPAHKGKATVVARSEPITHCWRCDYRSRLTRERLKTYVWCTSLEAAESCQPTPGMIVLHQEIVPVKDLKRTLRLQKQRDNMAARHKRLKSKSEDDTA